MSKLAVFFALLAVVLAAVGQGTPSKPPLAPAHSVTTTYFGVDIADPYRYMENVKDAAVQEWISEQSRYARSTLDSIPGRAELLSELKKLDESEPAKLSRIVVEPGDLFFYLKKSRGQEAYGLFRRQGVNGQEAALVDPQNSRLGGEEGGRISFFAPSFDGKFVLYGISAAGRENSAIHVLDTGDDQPLPDVISGIQVSSAGWMPDNHSFLYSRLVKTPASSPGGTSENCVVYLHKLGADPSSDVAVFGAGVVPTLRVPAGAVVSVETGPGSNYAVAALRHGSGRSVTLYAAPLAQVGKPGTSWTRIGNENVSILDYRLRGDELFLLVNGLRGPAIARVPLRDPRLDNWGLMFQLSPEETVSGLEAASDAVYLTVVQAGQTSLISVPYQSSREIMRAALPFAGRVSLYDEDPRVAGAYVRLSSWTRAPAIYRYDAQSDTVTRTNLWPAGPYDDPSDIVAVNATALGASGTLVPLTIIYKKGLQPDGTHPALLAGYGSASFQDTEMFRPRWRLWLDRGGVLAFAHVSGAEFGGSERFEQTGMANRFQDFLACAHYLIDQGYTTPGRLAGIGGNAGAILIGRAITEEPKLFRAAVIESGLLDPLRLESAGSGTMNALGLGNTKTLEGFRSLESVSSYEHVDPGIDYPAVLLEAGTEDVRFPAWQSAKMAARLGADSTSGLPVLLDVEAGRGDALAATETQRQKLFGDEVSFLFWQLGEPGFQPAIPGSAVASQ